MGNIFGAASGAEGSSPSATTLSFEGVVGEKWFREADTCIARVDARVGASNFFAIAAAELRKRTDESQFPSLNEFLTNVKANLNGEWDDSLRASAVRVYEETKKRWDGGVRGSSKLLNHLPTEIGQTWWDNVDSIYGARLQGAAKRLYTVAVAEYRRQEQSEEKVNLAVFVAGATRQFGQTYALDGLLTQLHTALTALTVDQRERVYQACGVASVSSSGSVSTSSPYVLDQTGLISSVAQEARSQVRLVDDALSAVVADASGRGRSSSKRRRAEDTEATLAEQPTRKLSQRSSSTSGSGRRTRTSSSLSFNDDGSVNQTTEVVETVTESYELPTPSKKRASSRRLTADEKLARELEVDDKTPLSTRRSTSSASLASPPAVPKSASKTRLSKKASGRLGDDLPAATFQSPSLSRIGSRSAASETPASVRRARSSRSSMDKLQRELEIDGFR